MPNRIPAKGTEAEPKSSKSLSLKRNKPSAFQVMLKNTKGQKVLRPDLSKAFLLSFQLNDEDYRIGTVELHDSSEWRIAFDNRKDKELVLEELLSYGDCYVVGSFQLTISGKRVCVIRKERINKLKETLRYD